MSGSKQTPRIAMIQPRLDGQGGLEKYGAFVIERLAQRFPLDVLAEHDVDLAHVEHAFGVKLGHARFINDPRCAPKPATGNAITRRTGQWSNENDYGAMTAPYDLVIGQSIGLPHRSRARRSVLLCHFPVVQNLRVDPTVPSSGLRSLLSSDGRSQRAVRVRLDSWQRIVCNSAFTRHWIDRYWARDADIINPPIDVAREPDLSVKKPWIVGVGFFSRPVGEQWSYKRQELLIDTFKSLCDAGLKGWELHLAGHVLPPTPDAYAHVEELRRRADNYPVQLHPNCAHSDVLSLYRHGSVFWHATGYGVDAEAAPERLEHFGMVTAESMSWGCVPVVVDFGGQPEIVQNDRNGFLWRTLPELAERTMQLVNQPALREKLAAGAIERASTFGLDRFRRQLDAMVDAELELLGVAH